ncbi:MAG: PRC-barrel domain-containing protein, partial [Candidatus Thorarchaeota archaeon]|nr:PRC-barrel domain-containing protein [Candidatus Thorarchaeota archaeon]
MEIARPFCCNEMKNKDVLDSNGKKIGHIGDLTFTFDGDLKLSHFILAGPLWETILETLHLKEDHNQVYDTSIIRKIDRHIHLTQSAEELASIKDETLIPDEEIRFSKMEKLNITDKNQVKVGHAIDVDIDNDGCASIIAGGSFIEEKLEAIGLKDDVDIIIPCSVIKTIGDTIELSVPKEELGSTLDGISKEKADEIQ